MNQQKGFTVIEIIIVIAFLLVAAGVGLSQHARVTNETHNAQKRTAINAMYYSLEEDFYKRQKFYPETIDDGTLPTMDTALLTDPSGKKIGDGASAYRYEPTNCRDGKCTSYTLRALLHNEADFVKESRNK